jgi:hypothetical protein
MKLRYQEIKTFLVIQDKESLPLKTCKLLCCQDSTVMSERQAETCTAVEFRIRRRKYFGYITSDRTKRNLEQSELRLLVGQLAAPSSKNGYTTAVHNEKNELTNEVQYNAVSSHCLRLVRHSLLSSRALYIINTLFPQRKRPQFMLTKANTENMIPSLISRREHKRECS